MTAPATDPAALLGALVDLVADAVALRLRVAGPAATSSAAPPSTWYTQETSPIARRTYLALCRSGTVESRRIGKQVLVERRVLDAWIVENGPPSALPAAASPAADAPTNEALMRSAGFSKVAAPQRTTNFASGRPRRAGKRAT